jgi:lipid II:glycine glycyltransferase (peptidoglycan interpeptide bridge formation enzyme)
MADHQVLASRFELAYTRSVMSHSVLVPVSPTDRQWSQFVQSRPEAHLLQTDEWGRLKAQFGWSVDRVALEVDGRIVAGAQMLCRALPWGQTLVYLPKGPLVDWHDHRLVGVLLETLASAARKRRAALLKIEPDLIDGSENAIQLEHLGFRPGQEVQPRSTVLIDLTPEPDDILGQMKSKWRYNVRLAARKGVIIRQGTLADLPTVYQLMKETADRDKFGIHEQEYYQAAHDLFASSAPSMPNAAISPQATWLFAEYEGELLAAIVVFACGQRAWYFWGASGDTRRNLMPNHLLQWTAIGWAREQGCTTYDLWGIPDDVGMNPAAFEDPTTWGKDGLWGVYRFKRGFGGQIYRTAGAWDMVISRWGYWLYKQGIRLRRRVI